MFFSFQLSKRNMFIISTVIIALAAVVIFLVFRSADKTAIDETVNDGSLGALPQSGNVSGTDADNSPELGGVSINSPDFGDQIILSDMKNRTEVFIERLTSYSNDSDLSNMTDLYPQMSGSLRANIIEKRASLLNNFDSDTAFKGYSIEVISAEVVDYSLAEGRINVQAKASKEITGGQDGLPEVIYVEYGVNWLKDQDSNEWLVNEFIGKI